MLFPSALSPGLCDSGAAKGHHTELQIIEPTGEKIESKHEEDRRLRNIIHASISISA